MTSMLYIGLLGSTHKGRVGDQKTKKPRYFNFAAMATSATILLLLAALLLRFASGEGYPKCWIRRGECLDNNEPPLRAAIKPQINHNVIGNSIANITTVDECADECYDNPDCRYIILLYIRVDQFFKVPWPVKIIAS